jgi:hypothetical protein
MDSENKDTVFCIDSSSFIYLHRYYPPAFSKDIWEEFEQLFSDGRIISHKIVFEELTVKSKKPDALTNWIVSKKQYFKGFTFTQAKFVSKIINEFPGLIDHSREKDEADPWLIALALEEQSQINLFDPDRKIIVVSEENKEKPQKIPAVCKRFGLDHLSLLEFYNYHGWIFKIERNV